MRRKSDPSGKKKSKLHVEPAELARKLIKELERSKVSRGGRTWVRDQYTIFLCREDFARFRSQLDQLVHKLESHMEKHMQNKRYATSGAVTVELTMDPDLKPGYFGVLAEEADYEGADPRVGIRESAGRSIWDVPEDIDYDDDYKEDYVDARSRGAKRDGQAHGTPPMTSTPAPTPAPFAPQPAAAPPMPSQPAAAPPMPSQPAVAPPMPSQPPVMPSTSDTARPARAAQAPVEPVAQAPVAPAVEVLVLTVNGQERVFPEGKAVVGRSREADVQIDNADVSRRHAVIYCSEGSVAVRDLGSTNGTMVNGYPVDKSVVRPSDVIRIGNARITAASR